MGDSLSSKIQTFKDKAISMSLESIDTKDVKEKVQNAQRRLTEKLDYHNGLPASDEFSKGFEHCCKVFKEDMDAIFKEEFGEELLEGK